MIEAQAGKPWIFIFAEDRESRGWWLKITDPDQLLEYHKTTDGGKWEEPIRGYADGDLRPENMSSEERIRKMISGDRSFLLAQAAVMMAQKCEGTFFDGIRGLRMEAARAEMRCIREDGAVFLNPAGGHTFGLNYSVFVRRPAPVFPSFGREDIRIRKFPGGAHFYAYVGDTQIRKGDVTKWNTYEAAREAAEEIVRG